MSEPIRIMGGTPEQMLNEFWAKATLQAQKTRPVQLTFGVNTGFNAEAMPALDRLGLPTGVAPNGVPCPLTRDEQRWVSPDETDQFDDDKLAVFWAGSALYLGRKWTDVHVVRCCDDEQPKEPSLDRRTARLKSRLDQGRLNPLAAELGGHVIWRESAGNMCYVSALLLPFEALPVRFGDFETYQRHVLGLLTKGGSE